jgi:hypothetical protein
MDNRDTCHETVAPYPPSPDNETVIVSLGAEGGGVMLLGRRGMEGSWECGCAGDHPLDGAQEFGGSVYVRT